MPTFEITINSVGSIDAVIGTLRATESQILTAATRAINKTAVWLKAQSVSAISEQTHIQQKLIREQLKIIKANRQDLKAFLIARLRGIKACDLGTMRQTKTGVRVGNHDFAHAFIAAMPSGHKGVFQRKTSDRLPIEEVCVPLEPHASKTIEVLLAEQAGAKFLAVFQHELSFLVRGR